MARDKSKTQAGKAISSGVLHGIESLVGTDPLFKHNQQYIARYFLDQNAILERAKELKNYAEQNRFNDKKALQYVHKGIERYVASGHAFSEDGKKAILNETLERKSKSGLLKGHGARKTLKSEDYLKRALTGVYQIAEMISMGRMQIEDPGVANVMKYVQEAGLLIPEMRLLRDKGKIGQREYRTMIKNVYNNIVNGAEYARQAVKDYAGNRMGYIRQFAEAKNIAASILGIFGITLALIGMKFTGAAIGVGVATAPAVVTIGIFAFILGILLFLKK